MSRVLGAALAALIAALIALLAAAPAAPAAPVVCPERFAVPGATSALPYCASRVPGAGIRRLVVAVHGTNRNAADYFGYAVQAAELEGADDVLTIAPQYLTAADLAGPTVMTWSSDGWKEGDKATAGGAVSSFAVLDALVRRLADPDVLPDLREVVVAGHSAGGQFAVRYAATTRIGDALGVPLHVVVANPSSYPYLTADRPVAASVACSGFDTWKYGLHGLNAYAGAVGAAGIRAQFGGRHVTYLLGDQDTNPYDSSLDTGCEAERQGPHRLARGRAFYDHVRSVYGGAAADQRLVTVAGVAHDGRAMLTSSEGRRVLFGPLPDAAPAPPAPAPAPAPAPPKPGPAPQPAPSSVLASAPLPVAAPAAQAVAPPAPAAAPRVHRASRRPRSALSRCLARAARKRSRTARGRARRACRRQARRAA